MSRASGTRCVSFAFQPELIGILQVLTDGINLFDPFELTAVLRRCVEPFVKLGTGFGALVPLQSYNPFAGLLIDGHLFVFYHFIVVTIRKSVVSRRRVSFSVTTGCR